MNLPDLADNLLNRHESFMALFAKQGVYKIINPLLDWDHFTKRQLITQSVQHMVTPLLEQHKGSRHKARSTPLFQGSRNSLNRRRLLMLKSKHDFPLYISLKSSMDEAVLLMAGFVKDPTDLP